MRRSNLSPTEPAKPRTAPRYEPIDYYLFGSLSEPSLRWLLARSRRSWEALYLIRLYLNAVIGQWNRIVGGLNERLRADELLRPGPQPPAVAASLQRTGEQIGLDIHFYLIGWDKLAKFFALLRRASPITCMDELLRPIQGTLSEVQLARHFFEHMDDRVETRGLPGYGQVWAGSSFTFGYEDHSKGGQIRRRQVQLGRAEIEKAVLAYRRAQEKIEVMASAENRPK